MRLILNNFISRSTIHSFYNSFSEINLKNDKMIAFVASLALGTFLIVMGYITCMKRRRHCTYKFLSQVNQKIHNLFFQKQKENTVSNLDPETKKNSNSDSMFWQSINTSNIDDLLNVSTVNEWDQHKENFFSINRKVIKEFEFDKKTNLGHEIHKESVIYFCNFKHTVNSMVSCSFRIENGQFKYHENGTINTQHYFDNFDQFLKYLFRGNFYQGAYFKVDYYILKKSDNSEIKYHNPF